MDEENFKYEYKDCIVLKSYFGLIAVNDVKKSWLYAIEKNLFPTDTIGFVLDYRDAHFDIEPGRHVEIPEFYRQHPEVFENKRIAIITENPDDIVYPMLIRLQDKGYESRPFSTMDAAVQWVLREK
ncbi:hypothetical protein [uncultured Draconibacterium sp.]|uniref:hypothetical protein n=1 Tax=uncultured Draconibacterium sp. TaxID=1573823 RepID=UPI0029C7CDE7|nr:hypothetical protein [uncultured Draconibacterium sp.]